MAAAGSAKAQAALKKQTEQQAAEYARVVSPLVCAAHRGASSMCSFCHPAQVGELELSDSLLQKVRQPVCAIRRPRSRLGIVLIPPSVRCPGKGHNQRVARGEQSAVVQVRGFHPGFRGCAKEEQLRRTLSFAVALCIPVAPQVWLQAAIRCSSLLKPTSESLFLGGAGGHRPLGCH